MIYLIVGLTIILFFILFIIISVNTLIAKMNQVTNIFGSMDAMLKKDMI